MSFLKATRSKLSTTLLLVALWLVYSTFSALATKAHKSYSAYLISQSGYSNTVTKASKEYVSATQGIEKEFTTETLKKLVIAGYLNISFQLSTGILIAYLAACIIHRKNNRTQDTPPDQTYTSTPQAR